MDSSESADGRKRTCQRTDSSPKHKEQKTQAEEIRVPVATSVPVEPVKEEASLQLPCPLLAPAGPPFTMGLTEDLRTDQQTLTADALPDIPNQDNHHPVNAKKSPVPVTPKSGTVGTVGTGGRSGKNGTGSTTPKPRNASSKGWVRPLFFKPGTQELNIVVMGSVMKLKCQLCSRLISYHKRSITTAFNHASHHNLSGAEQLTDALNRHYAALDRLDCVAPIEDSQQTRLEEFFQANPMSLQSEKGQQILRSLADWLVSALLPLSVVDSPYFHRFMLTLNHRYPNISKRDVKDFIKRMYKDRVKEIKALGLASAKPALTADVWTNENDQYYLTLTAYWMEQCPLHWKLNMQVLGSSLIGELEAQNRDEFNEIIQEEIGIFGLGNNTPTVVTDTSKTQIGSFDQKNVWGWISSACDCIHNAVARCLPVNERGELISENDASMYRSLKRALHFVSRIHVARSKLNELQEEQVAQECSITDCISEEPDEEQALVGYPIDKPLDRVLYLHPATNTRWNSIFFLLERLLKLEPSVKKYMQEAGSNFEEPLQDTDWDNLKHWMRALKPLRDVSVSLETSAHPTGSRVFRYFWKAINYLKRGCPVKTQSTEGSGGDSQTCDPPEHVMRVMEELADALLACMDDPTSIFAFVCMTYLDTSIANQSFLDEALYCDQTKLASTLNQWPEKHTLLDQVRTELKTLMLKCAREYNFTPSSLSKQKSASHKMEFLAFDEDEPEQDAMNAQPVVDLVTASPNNCSIEKYVDEEFSKFDSLRWELGGKDPLTWWGAQGNQFPLLKRVAMEKLSIPGSSLMSDRSFSNAAFVLRFKTARLESDIVQERTFLASELHAKRP